MSGQKCRADEPSASGWSAWALLVLSLWVVAPRAFAAPPDALPVVGLHTTIGIERAEAAPSGWEAASPPVTGWVPVRLPDDWNSHWPGHDGVVWYRLRWLQRPQARLDERRRRLPECRRHLHRLHHAGVPGQVHALYG